MIRRIDIALGLLLAFAGPGFAQTSGSFETMAQPEEPALPCVAPRPPRELHSFALVRNGYREILRIIAAERAIEARNCGCQFDAVSWDDAIVAHERFQTSDNPKLPFDVIALRGEAGALEAELQEVCSE
ncbi:hypothetical protein [Aliiroseovarius subalbicans]|uniref:hypothetical protein n=1 Tax=Aliiroseovarius subalbicans TaxID=2925840 RepID=UPI001F567875|nr:hypothetical protein [Aliiroseovarius subalbicans]MCI2401010.1 hypothetical protein [Aliiroseovarius subalbicans]